MNVLKSNLFLLFFCLITSIFAQDSCETALLFIEESEEIAPFSGLDRNLVAFSDIDADGDLDLFIQGAFYENDGIGNFTYLFGFTLTNFNGDVAACDIDGDNDLDILISPGSTSSYEAFFYINDGNGGLAYEYDTSITDLVNSSISFVDIDNDNDKDLIMCGSSSSLEEKYTKMYKNNGAGQYTEVLGTPFVGVDNGSIAIADIDGDNDLDVLITGSPNVGAEITSLYTNDGEGNFFYVEDTPFIYLHHSSAIFGDIDNDGDQDLLISGISNQFPIFEECRLYENDGSGNFTYIPDTPFPEFYDSSMAFIDIDNDNDIDVLMGGLGILPVLYTNDGNGVFTEFEDDTFTNAVDIDIDIVDIDGDNDQDIFISGSNTKFYRNESTTNPMGIDVQSSCSSYTWIDGNTYSANNNTATYIIPEGAENGCDSLVLLNLSIHTNTVNDIYSSCEAITWIDGITYTESNNSASYTYINSFGCDSIILLDLSINNTFGTDVINSCEAITWIDGNTYTANNNSASYTLNNAAGCDSLVTLNFTINSTSGTDVQSSCEPYIWIDGNTYTESNNSATYTLSNTSGCDSLVTLNLTINSINPTISYTSNILSVDINDASYQWVDCDNEIIVGAILQNFSPTTNGEYAVIVTKNGCTETSECINVSTIGIAESYFRDRIRIYPNPTEKVVNIDLNNLSDLEIKISNIMGEVLYHWEHINSPVFEFELNEAPGYYIIELKNKKGSMIQKLIKN